LDNIPNPSLFVVHGMFNAGNLSAAQQAEKVKKLRGYIARADQEPRIIVISPRHLEDFACAAADSTSPDGINGYCLAGSSHFPGAIHGSGEGDREHHHHLEFVQIFFVEYIRWPFERTHYLS
jgi:hypothetical protein